MTYDPGYNADYCEEQQIWRLLQRYQAWNCLMGCSIQSNPKDNAKVEAGNVFVVLLSEIL